MINKQFNKLTKDQVLALFQIMRILDSHDERIAALRLWRAMTNHDLAQALLVYHIAVKLGISR